MKVGPKRGSSCERQEGVVERGIQYKEKKLHTEMISRVRGEQKIEEVVQREVLKSDELQ